MTVIHVVLGAAVLLLNGAVAVRILALHSSTEGDVVLVGGAAAALGLQVATGFFLMTATIDGPGFLHLAVPAATLVGLILARVLSKNATSRAVGVASLVVVAAGAIGFVTGVVGGG